jgi:DNA-binding transcriptional ArsR family regulator
VHAFDVLGDPVRRRILELLAAGEQTSGALSAVIQGEFGISQPAVSQHLRVLRNNGFTTVRAEGARRLYAVDSAPLQEIDDWLERFRGFWNQRLDDQIKARREVSGRAVLVRRSYDADIEDVWHACTDSERIGR